MLVGTCVISACTPGSGPFQPSPWAGFPPSFAESPYSQYRAQYVADRARFDANGAAFMRGTETAEACDLSETVQKQFARDAFLPRPEHRTPTWQQVTDAQGSNRPAPIVDQAKVRVLAGSCASGGIEGKATVHADFLRLVPTLVDKVYDVTAVELLESCDYRGSRRDGDCARYEVLKVRQAYLKPDGQLSYIEAVPETTAVVFDYGAYHEDAEAGPGLAFETATLTDGTATNKTIARAAAGERIGYSEYTGGGAAHTTYFRRVADDKLHGPVLNGGLEVACYENGTRILRGGACRAE
jgi:hypothetical protein